MLDLDLFVRSHLGSGSPPLGPRPWTASVIISSGLMPYDVL